MSRVGICLLCVVFFCGCAATGGAVRELGNEENVAFDALATRLKENEKALSAALKTLSDVSADYAEKEFSLARALSKAKQLESMRAPWAAPTSDLVATQRAVILYHLYEVDQAEQKLLDALINERRAAAAEVLETYRQMQAHMKTAIEAQKLVLEYLNQPPSARIRAVTETFLGEVSAFRAQLQQSDNPRLQQLAEEVAHYEALADKAKEQAEKALETFMTIQER